MSANLPPFPAGPDPMLPAPVDSYSLQHYEPPTNGPPADGPAPDAGALNLSRFVAALTRYRWLIVLSMIVCGAVGFGATRFIEPEYSVNATVFATPTLQTGGGRMGGPVRADALTQNQGWRDLLKSFAITDPVVQQLALYLQPESAKDSVLFANFMLESKRRFRPGDFTLKTENGRYSLNDEVGFIHEIGTVGDSVGRTAGFAWVPPARLLGTRTRTVGFRVMTPREAAVNVRSRFDVLIDPKSPVIQLTLKGSAAQRPAATLNAMLSQFVQVASDLKNRELITNANALQSQLTGAQEHLKNAERELQNFRVSTISEPSESPTLATSSSSPNAEVGTPTFNNFFAHKSEYETLRRDRVALERIVQQMRTPGNSTPPEAILGVFTVTRDEAAMPLRQAVTELNGKQSELRVALQSMKDSNPAIIDMRRNIADLRDHTFPQRVDDYLSGLRTREADLGTQLASATTELQAIPQRTIQQGVLTRELAVASDIYTRLRASYAEATLARQASLPDVKILDSAVTPLSPSSNTAPKLIGFAIAVGLITGVGLAFLLDRVDTRFRYPEQAKVDLGLEVLGVIPVVDQNGRQSPESVSQIIEAFRTLRMNVRYASGDRSSVAIGITSPGPGDGKSLIASNLALAFAEGGWRTILIDADTRRGQLHGTFDSASGPGLVEYLEGTSLLSEVLAPTRHDNLTLLPCGVRHRRAPELLATPRMSQLIATLAHEFEVILIDTPPLGAGTDAYAIGTACGQLAVVLRNNTTNVKMAKAKLAVVRQLPITLLGAILNEVRTDSGMYEYYSYDAEYSIPEETPSLAAGTGTAVAVQDR